MLVTNEGALAELRRFGEVLSEIKRPESSVLRQALARLGRFVRIEPVKPDGLIVAVDGSCQTVGASYPYFLTLVQAVALSLPPRQPLVRHRLFSPLFPEERAELETRAGESQSVEVTAELRVRELMAEAELAVACEAARQYRDGLILLDGGFVHFRARAETLFEELAEAAARSGCLLVGTIEEVSSRLLCRVVDGLWTKDSPAYDREILYGCLAVGEAFILPPEVHKEKGISTVFARFAAHPQPVAFDFLTGREREIPWVLGVLRALTPFDGRGIPAVLDIADRYVRLTAAEVEQLVAAAVPPEVREVFLTAHRLRRAL